MIWGGRGEAGSFVGVSRENFLVFVCGWGEASRWTDRWSRDVLMVRVGKGRCV